MSPPKHSFWEDVRDSTLGRFLNLKTFVSQRRQLMQEPMLVVSDAASTLCIKPLVFALQGTLLSTGLVLAFSSALDFLDPRPTRAQIELRDAEEIESRKLAAFPGEELLGAFRLVVGEPTDRARRWVYNEEFDHRFLTKPLWAGAHVVVAAAAFGFLFRRRFPVAAHARQAERAYLYFGTAAIFVPVLSAVGLSEVIDQSFRRGFDLRFLEPFLALIFLIWYWRNIWRTGRPASEVLGIAGPTTAKEKCRATAMRIVVAVLIGNLLVFVPLAMMRIRYADLMLEHSTAPPAVPAVSSR